MTANTKAPCGRSTVLPSSPELPDLGETPLLRGLTYRESLSGGQLFAKTLRGVLPHDFRQLVARNLWLLRTHAVKSIEIRDDQLSLLLAASPHVLLDLPQRKAKPLNKRFLELVPLKHTLVTDKKLRPLIEEVENDSP